MSTAEKLLIVDVEKTHNVTKTISSVLVQKQEWQKDLIGVEHPNIFKYAKEMLELDSTLCYTSNII